MCKRALTALFILFAFCVAGYAISPAAAAKSYSAERYDVAVAVQPDGALIVTEMIIFRFEGGPFTYVFRELAYNNLDEIDQIQASLDGQVLAPGTQAGQVEIVAGRPLRVTWHFEPTRDATREFNLVYRVLGAIQPDAQADRLNWMAIPAEHEYSIARSVIRLEYPANLALMSPPALQDMAVEPEIDGNTVTFSVQEIRPNTPIVLSVGFPVGSMLDRSAESGPASGRTKTAAAPTAWLGGLLAAAVAGLLSLAGLIRAGLGFRRESSGSPEAAAVYTAPPKPIPPALAAHLVGSTTPFLGALFDLAQRGVVQIEERPKKWGSRKFEVVRLPGGDRLRPHEEILMAALFKKARNNRVNLDEIASLASNSQFIQALDQELASAGWRDAGRARRKTRFMVLSGVGLAIGGTIFLGGMLLGGLFLLDKPWAIMVGAILMGGGGALGLVSLAGLFVGAFVSPLSADGLRQASAWNSFTGYLRNVARGRETSVAPDLFERYLPYAASFGVATEWAGYFSKVANVKVPAWFQGLQTSLDDGSFAAIMAAVSAADASASVATGADGGGASGGGASGAG